MKLMRFLILSVLIGPNWARAQDPNARKFYGVAEQSSLSTFSSRMSYYQPPEELNNWEFKTAPVALLARWYTLDISYRLNRNWATGPAAVYYGHGKIGNMFAPAYNGFAVGWNLNYYFRSVMKHGWYLGSHAYYERFESFPHAFLGYEEREGFRGNLVAGYRWHWKYFNLALAAGGETRQHHVVVHEDPIDGIEYEPSSHNENRFLGHVEVKIGIDI